MGLATGSEGRCFLPTHIFVAGKERWNYQLDARRGLRPVQKHVLVLFKAQPKPGNGVIDQRFIECIGGGAISMLKIQVLML